MTLIAASLVQTGLLCSEALESVQGAAVPPRVVQAQRFLRERSIQTAVHHKTVRGSVKSLLSVAPQTAASTAVWQPLGPKAVQTANFGLVTGRVTALAFDPADSTGNTVFAGTTGGGLWLSGNAAASNAADVVFRPLTDNVGVLKGVQDASISIGAVTVQPGGTGVILAGTGDINDALDSYYGAGLLRSTDNGSSWNLIPSTSDGMWRFLGEGFAGFAWSTTNPQLVVAAVAQAYTGTLDNAPAPGASYQGLYYSTDAGASWTLATITDGGSTPIQGPASIFALPDGNAATSVVWNPVRHVFLAAIRYHGYYQSTDGITWTRLAAQPGVALTTTLCPTNTGATGSQGCPIFRGTLAVNPVTGDTFAWTVDVSNQDQGIWQDSCAISAGACTNQTVTFATQINTAALEADQPGLGAVTIGNGDYNLALAAVPAGQDTLLLAGANDLWKCSLAAGCVWRNTTNAPTCRSAGVGEYQHAIAWNTANSMHIFDGNDSGLWRSMDAIGETGSACDTGDATHFDNLNGSLGSLAETVNLADVTTSPYTLLAGLGVNGAAGVKSTAGPTDTWPQVLDGEGGPVAIDPANPASWYVNNQAGVSIHLCSQSGNCTATDFGSTPVVSDADVGGDGYTMTLPAPFLIDPLDAKQLIVGTCRVWRGPADGSAWTSDNALSGFLDGISGSGYCNGNALIRSMAAAAVPGGGEVIYVGMYGAFDGGTTLAGHVFRAAYSPGGGAPVWQDLALNPVSNDDQAFNAAGMDISSIYIDPHDTTGNTVYATVQGVHQGALRVRTVYRSTDGGAHWTFISLGLPWSPANSIAVDPQDINTVYLATDAGVFATQQIAACATSTTSCWSAYGSGLPMAPVTHLRVAPSGVSPSVLVAGTYGRGIWQIPLATAGAQSTTATVDPTSLSFGSVAFGTPSTAQTVTLTNTGGIALTVTSIIATGDFTETDNCQTAVVNSDASCTIQVVFTPSQAGARTGQLTINGNFAGGQLTVALSGTGGSPGMVTLLPTQLSFGSVQVGATSSALQVTVQNQQSSAVSISKVSVTAPFALASNACGTTLAANSSCQLTVTFAPTQSGSATGTLSVTDNVGTQSASLAGTGEPAATDTLSPTSLTFGGTVIGESSSSQTVTLTNSGGMPLTSIAISATGPFTESSACGTILATNSSCSISVAFLPTASGAATGQLTVADALHTQTAALSGTGLLAPAISVNAPSATFAVQAVETASAPQTLTMTNSGGSPMASLSFSITGVSASSFATGASTCGTTIASGASCTVQVIFKPAAAGGNAATLAIASPTPRVNPVTVALVGTATASAGINVSPAQMAFTVATLGQSSAAQTATITNTGASSASGLTVATAAPFSLASNTCGASLAAGGSCSVGVVFTPASDGAAAGALAVNSTNLNAATVLLSGAGGAAGSVLLQPGSLVFPTTPVGSTNTAQAVTVTNNGPVAFTDLALTASSGFQIQSTTCTTQLAMGASCAVAVVFSPTVAGAASGTLTATSSALAAGVTTALSGTGFDFTVIAPSPAYTVASGQTATFNLTIAPVGGAGTFTLSCGSLPSNSACSFNPTNQTIAAGTTGTVQLSIATGQTAAAIQPEPRPGWGQPLALCGLLLVPLAWRRRQRLLLLVVLLVAFAGGVTGCVASGGGGGTATGSKNATPAGTYTVQVTATSNGLAHSTTLKLTVD
ncbi:MAG: choice-of-anchor D domain-containing protein [Terracidiphilus sp.]|nr:choice-of-anchor D domain-containing protein [Terracidiphilus sp.]